MTKQEEIREYIARELLPDWVIEDDIQDISLSNEWIVAGEIMAHLSELGVVIAVIPDDTPQIYRAVEPLIGEINAIT